MNPPQTVTVWVLHVGTDVTVHGGFPEAVQALRDNHACDDDVPDDDLIAFVLAQGQYPVSISEHEVQTGQTGGTVTTPGGAS